MADQTTNLRVRISADLNDIKQGLAVLQGRLGEVRKDAAKPLPANNGIQQLGISAGQTAAAMRQLPAQFTDIVTSLQGGMPFFTVLLQQGGQIRDSFGSTKEALRGIGVGLLGLVNPITVSAAALGLLVYEVVQGEQRINRFNEALILTGRQGEISAQQRNDLAESIGELPDVSGSDAAEALTEIASSGKIAAENFRLVAQAAAAMQDATGKAIQTTVSEYAEIAQDPVQAILKLNESERFLTQSTFERIAALQEAGDVEGAAALATEARAQAQIERAHDVVESLGLVTGAWHELKNAIGDSFDASGSFFAQLDLDAKQAASTLAGFFRNFKLPSVASVFGMQAAVYGPGTVSPDAGAATQAKGNQIVDSDQAKAEIRFREETNRLLGTTLDLEGQIKKMREDAAKQGVKDAALLDAREAALRAAAAKKSASGVVGAESSAGLQALRDQEARDKSQRDADTRVLQAQYQAREITVEQYYDRLRELTQQGSDAEASSIQKQIAYLQKQSASGKDAVAIGQQIATLESKLAQVRTEGAAAQQQVTIQEGAAVKARTSALASYKSALDSSTSALQAEMDAAVARVGSGDREYEVAQRINGALRERAERINDLTLQRNAGQLTQADFDAEVAAVQRATDERVRIIEEGYARMDAAQADWSNGATAAWANYARGATDVAGQVESALGNAFTGLEDIWVQFTQTGKVSFSDFTRSVLADYARIEAKQGLTALVRAAGQAWGPEITGFDQGGWTGPGGVHEPAGVVHKGEVVWSQRDVARAGGVGVVEAMRLGYRGYADGGVVGAAAPLAAGGLSLSLNIKNESSAPDLALTSRGARFDAGTWVLDLVASDMAAGGKTAKATSMRFNLPNRGNRYG
ncbi:hypothetical protein BV378_14225 [Nostoc sp. RF31YmG]|jgi:lambda family phage tail tape measure protein|nr:hypothetical protein BV378_14225 [Nostoc sp. RF31YmG]